MDPCTETAVSRRSSAQRLDLVAGDVGVTSSHLHGSRDNVFHDVSVGRAAISDAYRSKRWPSCVSHSRAVLPILRRAVLGNCFLASGTAFWHRILPGEVELALPAGG